MYNGKILEDKLNSQKIFKYKSEICHTHEIAHLYKDSEMLSEITIKLKCIRKKQVFPKINNITNSK